MSDPANTICFHRSSVERAAKNKPEGYMEEAERLNISTSNKEICFTQEGFQELKKKFPRVENKSFPSFSRMVKSVAKVAVDETKAIAQKEPPVSEEEQKKRLEICMACEYFAPNIQELPESKRKQQRCVKCGCFMKFKSRLRSQHCPVNKW
jgi:glycerol-3-phosphate cytidylyltransferase-like family protein